MPYCILYCTFLSSCMPYSGNVDRVWGWPWCFGWSHRFGWGQRSAGVEATVGEMGRVVRRSWFRKELRT